MFGPTKSLFCLSFGTNIIQNPLRLQMILAQSPNTSLSYHTSNAETSRSIQGPANPFKIVDGNALKRKNVLTGFAEEAVISNASFNTHHRTFQSNGYAQDPSATGQYVGDLANVERFGGRDVVQMRPSKVASEAFRRKRQKKGDSSIVDGDGAYRGPWARYDSLDQAYEDEANLAGEKLASDEEYIEESIVPARAPAMDRAATSYEDDVSSAETSAFHGSQLYDYQGRSYMHVPLDLGIDLRKEVGLEKNYHPKKQIFKWKFGSKPITALRFFPSSGHLLLSASADSRIKLWSVYNERELLRSYSGHSKSVSDIAFSSSGTQFLSGSYDRKMVLWDVETGKVISRFNNGKIPHVIKFHPDPSSHEFLAGMSDNKIVQFDIRSGELTQEYNHHLASINSKILSFHPVYSC